MSRAGIFRVSEGIAVDMNNRVFRLPSLHNVLEGEIFLQNLPSIVTAHALDPQKGERILDMCAAPGGKTTAIALIMKDEGEVVAADRSHNKVMEIQKLAAELGLTCIKTYKLDALKSVYRATEPDDLAKSSTSYPVKPHEESVPSITSEEQIADEKSEETVSSQTENGSIYSSKASARKAKRRMKNGPGRNQQLGGRAENSRGFHPNSFDRVLLDAPCSALGLRPRLFAGEVSPDQTHCGFLVSQNDPVVDFSFGSSFV